MMVCVPAVAEKTTGAMGNIVAATGLVKKDEFPTDMNVCIYCLLSWNTATDKHTVALWGFYDT